jgi:hypothetical protein
MEQLGTAGRLGLKVKGDGQVKSDNLKLNVYGPIQGQSPRERKACVHLPVAGTTRKARVNNLHQGSEDGTYNLRGTSPKAAERRGQMLGQT